MAATIKTISKAVQNTAAKIAASIKSVKAPTKPIKQEIVDFGKPMTLVNTGNSGGSSNGNWNTVLPNIKLDMQVFEIKSQLNRIFCSEFRTKMEGKKKGNPEPLPPIGSRAGQFNQCIEEIRVYLAQKASPRTSLIQYICRYFRYTGQEATGLVQLYGSAYGGYPTGNAGFDSSMIASIMRAAIRHYYTPERYDYLGKEIIEVNSSNKKAIENGAAPMQPAPLTPENKSVFNNMLFSEDNRIEVSFGRYGWTRNGGTKFHSGLDISTLGDPTIHSTVSGIVIFSGAWTRDNRSEWGNCIIIKDKDGYYHLFAHCDSLSVRAGQDIHAGQAIAIMGISGNAGYGSGQGAHVHYEIRTGVSLTDAGIMGKMFGGGISIDPSPWSGVPNVFEGSGNYNSENWEINRLSWYDPR